MGQAQRLERERKLVDEALERLLPSPGTPPGVIHEAMRYSVFSGGKRLRPLLAIAAHRACGGKSELVYDVAAAIEMVHTYSLIHDDLPCMDDGDYRRGNPTLHRVYGEAIAVLAGDGLLTEAFTVLGGLAKRGLTPSAVASLVLGLSEAAGSKGMVGGQVADIQAEHKEADADIVEFIHLHKTAVLIAHSVVAGGVAAGAKTRSVSVLEKAGLKMGLAFQIVDDLLDLRGDPESMGKKVGGDAAQGKVTYPAVHGEEEADRRAHQLVEEAKGILQDRELTLGGDVKDLLAIADKVVGRTS